MASDKKLDSDVMQCRFLEGVRRRCPDNILVLESLGDLYTRTGMIEEGLVIDRELTSRHPDNETYWYNLACSYSLLGQKETAITAIKRAVNLGYDDIDWMLKDSDLNGIRTEAEFLAIIDFLKQRAD